MLSVLLQITSIILAAALVFFIVLEYRRRLTLIASEPRLSEVPPPITAQIHRRTIILIASGKDGDGQSDLPATSPLPNPSGPTKAPILGAATKVAPRRIDEVCQVVCKGLWIPVDHKQTREHLIPRLLDGGIG